MILFVCREDKEKSCRCQKSWRQDSDGLLTDGCRRICQRAYRRTGGILSVGFETTTPASCLSVKKAREAGLTNYALLTANKTMPGAYETLKDSADVFLSRPCQCDHRNCAVRKHLAEEGISGVVAGFTAKEPAYGTGCCTGTFPGRKTVLCECLSKCGKKRRKPGGTETDQRTDETMRFSMERTWYDQGSGLRLRKEAQDFDARVKFSIPKMEGRTSPACRCGDVLQGKCSPTDCKVFGKGLYTTSSDRSLYGIE